MTVPFSFDSAFDAGMVPDIAQDDEQKVYLFPTSFAQGRLWFLEQLEPGNAAYHLFAALRLQGELVVSALQWSIDALVQRHESLRTTFELVEGQPVQAIAPYLSVPLETIDLNGFEKDEQEALVQHHAQEEVSRPFHLTSGPLLRITLVRLEPEAHVLFVTLHHIVGDAWSADIFFRELDVLYAACCTQTRPSLAELPIQYADYAVWQREWLQGEVLEQHLTYWKDHLSEAPAVLELPTDHPRPPVQTYNGRRRLFTLPITLSNVLEAFSRKMGVTLYMTLLAAFQTLLARYTGQHDIVVGTPIAGRGRVELEGLMGLFANTLALRGDLSGDPAFAQLLGRIREMCLGAYAHQELPFERLVEELGPERTLSYHPLFQVMFILQNARELPRLAGLEVTSIETARSASMFDLTLSLWKESAQLHGFFEYNADLFESATIERMVGHWQRLLEGCVATPEQRISRLSLLPDEERQRLLVGWNQTQAVYPEESCIHQLFEQQVERTPDAIAVVYEQQALTYRALNQQANRLANYLRHRYTIGPESRVGLALERSLDLVITILAVLKAGAAYVPIDPEYPQERIAFVLQDATVPVLLAQTALKERLPVQDEPLQTPVVWLDADQERIALEPDAPPPRGVLAENLAYTIYTSGSTGRPKGVQISHRAVVNFLCAMRSQLGVTERDVWPALTSLSFDIAGLEVFLPLLVGARIVLVGRDTTRDARELADLLTAGGVTMIQATPATWQMLLEAGWQGRPEMRLLCGGEALPPDLASRLRESGTVLWNMYGPTETTIWSMCERVERVDGSVPIGRPLANTRIYLLDARLEPVPIGVPGELYIGGDGLGRGYFARPHLTAERFVPDPFSGTPGMRLYKTGDLARYRPDGTIEFLGRTDHQVKIHGFRIELQEIEAVLRQHPAVREAVVQVWEAQPGDRRLVAYVVAAPDKAPASSDLHTFLSAHLPLYMVPAMFVALDALPLTPNGKVDRRALPMPENRRAGLGNAFVAPASQTERMLVDIWTQVLGMEQIGITDNYFALGGDSILSIQMVSKAAAAGLPLTPRLLFQHQTIAQLAAVIGTLPTGPGRQELVSLDAGGDSSSDFPEAMLSQAALDALLTRLAATTTQERRERVKPEIEAIYPLSPMQEGILFQSLAHPRSEAYVEQIAWWVQGKLDVPAFKGAWQQVMAQHEILRTLFLWEEIDTLLQVVLRHVDLPWTEEDWQGGPADEQDARLQAWLRTDRVRGFEFAHAPLFRVHLIHLDDHTVHFTWSFHHLLLDGWSTATLLGQVFTCYEALRQGQDVAPPASRPYREYIRWVRQQDLSLAERFWREALRGFRTPTTLAITHPSRPHRETPEGYGDQDIHLSATTTVALQDLARREQLTLNTLVQGAWALLLARYSGTSDLAFGVIVSGRPAELAGVASMVGLFINTIPLRASIEPRQPLMSWLRQVQAQQAEARQYEYSPLVHVQSWSEVPRGQPLFESVLIFENYPVDTSMRPSHGLVISKAQVTERTHYPLTLMAIPGSRLRLHISYRRERFEPAMIQHLGHHLQTLLEEMIAHPYQRLDHLSLVTEAERQQIVVEWNATHTAYPPDQSIPELFEAQVRRTPDAIALTCENQHLTYGELDRRANCLAHYLQRRGVGPEALVDVCLERSLALVIGLLGVLKAGGAYVPLDPASPRDRLGAMLADMQTYYTKGGQPMPPVVLTQQSLRAALPAAEAQIVLLDAQWAEMAQESGEQVACQMRGEQLASVIYTSGSTGQPKGVAGTHQATVNRLQWMWERFPFAASEVCCQKTSIGFVDSIWELLGPLLQGIHTVILADGSVTDPQRLVRTLSQQQVTRLVVVPSLLQAMLETCPDLETDLAGLQYLVSSGEALGVELAARWRSLLPHCTLLNLYGSSEVAADATYYPVASCEGLARIPIGRPIANTQVYVLDEQLGLAPPGVPGSLAIGGLGLARGYLNQPALTAERFVPDPWSSEPGARLYWTGDLGYAQPDGTLEILGRSDRQVKIRGSRIELGEIEAALVQHPAVREGMVVARTEPSGEQRLVAYVVLREEDQNGPVRATGATAGERGPLTMAALRAFLREKVPAYMLPSAMVRLPVLPLLSNGKVDRGGLSVPGGLPLAEPEPETDEKAVARPRTAIEEVLSGVWEDVLGLKRVGIFDNFFDVGGDSLRAIRAISRVRALFQVEISVMDLFDAPTVAGLAAVLLTYETVAGRISAIANVRLKLKRMSAREVQEQLQQKREARG